MNPVYRQRQRTKRKPVLAAWAEVVICLAKAMANRVPSARRSLDAVAIRATEDLPHGTIRGDLYSARVMLEATLLTIPTAQYQAVVDQMVRFHKLHVEAMEPIDKRQLEGWKAAMLDVIDACVEHHTYQGETMGRRTYNGHIVYEMVSDEKVAVFLERPETTKHVWCSPPWKREGYAGRNCYVLAGNPDDPKLCCVNGIGAIQWIVHERELEHALECEALGVLREGITMEGLLAARHFGMDAAKPWGPEEIDSGVSDP